MARLAVAIASLGRPQSVAESIAELRRQTRPADKIIYSVTKSDDLPGCMNMTEAEIIFGQKGSCIQRNRAIDALINDYDYIVFLDDDYVPSKFALERIEAFFDDNPDVVGIMGHMLDDGIKGPGIPYKTACEIVSLYDAAPRPEVTVFRDVVGLYGCNMAVRASAIGEVRFDENLPLYGWLEDNDFSFQLLARGRLVHTNAFAGVHCGVKSARSPGVQLGYSQVANPIYMCRKGTKEWGGALRLIARNVLANHIRSLHPEPWVDRWGRVRGNWLAALHFLTGKLSPSHILKL